MIKPLTFLYFLDKGTVNLWRIDKTKKNISLGVISEESKQKEGSELIKNTGFWIP